MLFDSVNNLCLTSQFWASTQCAAWLIWMCARYAYAALCAPKSRQQWATETDVLSEILWDWQCQCERVREREIPVIEWLRKCIVYVHVCVCVCVSFFACTAMWQLLLLTFFDCATDSVLMHVLFSYNSLHFRCGFSSPFPKAADTIMKLTQTQLYVRYMYVYSIYM